jgi:3-isopropylmalate dehydrogenase
VTALADRSKTVNDEQLAGIVREEATTPAGAPRRAAARTARDGGRMALKVALLPGDGIGPEVTAEAARLLARIADLYGHPVRFRPTPSAARGSSGMAGACPEETLAACLAADAVLLGAVGHPRYDDRQPGDRPEAGLLALRQALGGFANLRPAICHPALIDRTPFRA